MDEQRELIRNLGRDVRALHSRPTTDRMSDVTDAQMLEGFEYLLTSAQNHRIYVNSDTLAVIDWVRKLTMTGKLNQLVAENS